MVIIFENILGKDHFKMGPLHSYLNHIHVQHCNSKKCIICYSFKILSCTCTLLVLVNTPVGSIWSVALRCELFLYFFLFSKKKLHIVVVRDVCPSVCPSVRLSSVEIIYFRGNLISNKPIVLKIGLNVR